MAALQTTQVTLPTDVCLTVVGKAHDTSTIATLSPADKLGFLDDKYNVFNGKARVEVVAEGAKKGGYEQPIVPKEGKRFTVQCTTRVSKQLQWADEDDQLQILDAIQSDQAAALGEALDYVVYHAVNPASGETLTGYNRIVRRSRAGARRGRCARQPRPAGRPAAESQHQRHRPVPRVRQHAAQAARHRHRRTPVPGDPAEPERRNHRRHPRVHLHHRRRRIRHHSDECARLHGRFHHDPLATRPPDHRRGHSLRRPRQHRHRPGRIQPSGIPFRGVFSYAILDPKALAVLKTATASRSAKITK